MAQHRWWLLMLNALVLALCGTSAPAQIPVDLLKERVQQLPGSYGDNTDVTWRGSESWVDIGIREHVGYEHLRRANAAHFVRGRKLLIPGRRIAVRHVDDGLVLNLPELMVYRWAGGAMMAHYPVSIGMITERWHTPMGRLEIATRIVNPTWQRPEWGGGGIFPPGPNNPLGDRWIGLNRFGYGLHGTNDPTSIGRTVSHGCIRLFPPHIHELFDNTQVGMPVIITYETIAVGQHDGVIDMVVFPDVYARGTNKPARVREMLATYGVDTLFTAQELSARLRQADGVARPLLGSSLGVTVNGMPVDTVIRPTKRGNMNYLPVAALAEISEASTTWDASGTVVTAQRGTQTVTFAPKQGFTALSSLFVPVRAWVEGLGGAVKLVGDTIVITFADTPA